MYCSNCGHSVPDDAKKCPYCGHSLAYEREEIRKHPLKKKRGVKTALAILLVVAGLAALEAFWLFGLPQKGGAGSSVQESGGEPGGITNLLASSSAAASDDLADASVLDEYNYLPSSEPTPTPTVTPLADMPETAASTIATPTPTPTPTATPSPTPTPTTSPSPTPSPAATSNDYVLATSSTQLITESQLKNYDAGTIRLIRNEIYARHGLIFKSGDLQQYFSSKSWYKGTVSNASAIKLNNIEKQNVDTIYAYEKKTGINQ